MAFPGLFRRLFANNGAGPQLRADILPAIDKYELGEIYYFRHPTLKAGFQAAQGGLIAGADTKWPKAWAYLQTTEGKKLCKTEAEWQALVNAVWHTNADGTKVGWGGIGGAPWYVVDVAAKTLRLPDLRGMYAEAAGFDALGVGGVHGDAMRGLYAYWGYVLPWDIRANSTGAASWTKSLSLAGMTRGDTILNHPCDLTFSSERVTPVGNKTAPRAWGALACVCLDPSAS